jgi:hypothetical protein
MAKRKVASQIANFPNSFFWEIGKLGNWIPISLHASGMRHAIEKLLIMDTTFLQTSSQSEVYTQSYGPPKSWESQLWEFRDSHLGVLGQNDIWVLAPWQGPNYFIREKMVASPKSMLCWVLWIRVCPWLICAPKALKLYTNQLVVWFV